MKKQIRNRLIENILMVARWEVFGGMGEKCGGIKK